METIARGNNFFVWNGYWEKNYGDSLANYATAYLFFQWLRIQAGGTVYSAISNSTYRDYQAVTQAVKGWIPGITETNDAAIIWDQLLSSWMIANVIKAQTGLYGYKGEIDVQVKMSTDVNKYVQFFPGEGRYSSLKSTSFTNDKGSGSNIKYRGITKQSSGITDSSPYTGDVLLTYNANPQPSSGSGESGFVMDYLPAPSSLVSASAGTARLAISSGELPSSYPIGAHDLWAQGSAGGAGPQPVQ
jgi:hypothetical protein